MFSQIAIDVLKLDGVLPVIHNFAPLAYLIRRFGFPANEWNGNKEIVGYRIPTSFDGLYVWVWFSATSCWIKWSATNDVRRKAHTSDQLVRDAWLDSARAFAAEKGFVPIPIEETLYIKDDTAFRHWYNETIGDDPLVENDEDRIPNGGWTKVGMEKYTAWLEEKRKYHGQAWEEEVERRDSAFQHAYQLVLDNGFPEPNFNMEAYESNPEVGPIFKAYREALNDLLRPVLVDDVPINILGALDESKYTFNDDEETLIDEVPHAQSAGYGVPKAFLVNPKSFIVAELGMVDGNEKIDRVKKTLDTIWWNTSHTPIEDAEIKLFHTIFTCAIRCYAQTETVAQILQRVQDYVQERHALAVSDFTKKLLKFITTEVNANDYLTDSMITSNLYLVDTPQSDLDEEYKQKVVLQKAIGKTPVIVVMPLEWSNSSTAETLVKVMEERVISSAPCTLYGVRYESLNAYQLFEAVNNEAIRDHDFHHIFMERTIVHDNGVVEQSMGSCRKETKLESRNKVGK